MAGTEERVAERLGDAKVARDTRLLGDFQVIYCDGNHGDAARAPLDSVGASLGVYGDEPPVICEDCARFLRYAETRRALCPHDPKPQCKNCPKHCYKPEMRETARAVMRYSGPRSVLHGHAVDAIVHALDKPIQALRHRGDRA